MRCQGSPNFTGVDRLHEAPAVAEIPSGGRHEARRVDLQKFPKSWPIYKKHGPIYPKQWPKCLNNCRYTALCWANSHSFQHCWSSKCFFSLSFSIASLAPSGPTYTETRDLRFIAWPQAFRYRYRCKYRRGYMAFLLLRTTWTPKETTHLFSS